MYADIKSNNKILINRLDDSERILLKDICDRANADNKVLTMSPLTDESGDFGGVFIELTDAPVKPEEEIVEEHNPEQD